MKILSIETSCDETAISIVEAQEEASGASFNVLANITLSQAKLHAEYGGVFPNLAKREHSKNLVPVLKQALEDADMLKITENINLSHTEELVTMLEREPKMLEQFLELIPTIEKPKVDVIAVTNGPGLEPALWVGVNFAKALSLVWGIPVIPINHMEGHILAALLQEVRDSEIKIESIKFPAIALLISGGHTELVLMKDPHAGETSWMDYEVIGQTRDDAVGEAFDKVARMLGLPYPGGPEISKLAEQAQDVEEPPYPLPRPMIKTDDYDFSFSGLKTAVLYTVKKLPQITPHTKEAIALEFEEAVTEILLKKTLRAAEEYGAKTIIIGGGVSANRRIRGAFEEKIKKMQDVELFVPDAALSTDNALMIAVAGYFKASSKQIKTSSEGNIRAEGNLSL
jgi:N6-L-threonylcarbamoyladenine synthase